MRSTLHTSLESSIPKSLDVVTKKALWGFRLFTMNDIIEMPRGIWLTYTVIDIK